MAPQPTLDRPSRRIIAVRLRLMAVALAAVVLAGGSVSPAIALSPATAVAVATVQAPQAPVALGAPGVGASASALANAGLRPTGRAVVPAVPVQPTRAPAQPKPAPATSFRGVNHVWIPALGIDRTTFSFPCSRSQAPANYVYRWGCAGSNNMYLIGHAYGVFKSLHDAYYNGRLKVGLTAVYADGAGRIRTYRVAWWRVVRPTTAAKWAWASLATPGMTLQTCLGANSEYRLMVRLVRVS